MKKNNLDEMQEQKLLKIEHNACWLAFWGLFGSIMVQALMGTRPTAFLGELVLMVALCGYIVTACLRQGIWDRTLTPDPKTNFLLSLGAGGFVWIVCWLILGRLELDAVPHMVISACLGGVAFILCVAALALCSKAYKTKRDQLEQE